MFFSFLISNVFFEIHVSFRFIFNVFVHDCLSVSKPLEQILLCEGSRPNDFPNNSGCSLCIVCDLSQFSSNPSP